MATKQQRIDEIAKQQQVLLQMESAMRTYEARGERQSKHYTVISLLRRQVADEIGRLVTALTNDMWLEANSLKEQTVKAIYPAGPVIVAETDAVARQFIARRAPCESEPQAPDPLDGLDEIERSHVTALAQTFVAIEEYKSMEGALKGARRRLVPSEATEPTVVLESISSRWSGKFAVVFIVILMATVPALCCILTFVMLGILKAVLH